MWLPLQERKRNEGRVHTNGRLRIPNFSEKLQFFFSALVYTCACACACPNCRAVAASPSAALAALCACHATCLAALASRSEVTNWRAVRPATCSTRATYQIRRKRRRRRQRQRRRNPCKKWSERKREEALNAYTGRYIPNPPEIET